MSDKTWKASERAIGRRLGGRRVGHTGRNTQDVAHAWLSIEVKSRRRLPAWLLDAVCQAVRNAPVNRLALVILHQVSSRHDDDLVIVRLSDFQDWFGDVPAPEPAALPPAGGHNELRPTDGKSSRPEASCVEP